MPRVKYRESRELFVNPYFFVKLEDKCIKKYSLDEIKNDKNLLTGWIDCELESIKPIFIPNTTNDNIFQFEKGEDTIKSYDFYSYKDLSKEKNNEPLPPEIPIIPGSELRGMIRMSFETLTNSCLSTIDDEQILYRRVSIPADPGRLRKNKHNEWEIQPCLKYKVKRRNERLKSKTNQVEYDGQPVFFTHQGFYVKDFSIDQKYDKKGYYHFGAIFTRKHDFIFVPKNGSIPIQKETVDKTLKNLLNNFKLYNNEKINLNLKDERPRHKHSGYSKFRAKNSEDLNGALIYFKEYKVNHNGKQVRKLYLCPANIGREVFYVNLKKVIGTYKACNTINNLCPACILFGFTSPEYQLASRVRFTDAIPNIKFTLEDYLNIGIIDELASPKLTATEFYLEKPRVPGYKEVHLWNYDYAGYWKKNREGRYTRNFATLNNYKPKIRGRKYYWHQKTKRIRLRNPSDEGVSKRNVGVRPLKPGKKFEFKVYFNNIKPSELKKLIWILQIGNYSNNAHKIGMGKPLGLGSVKINVKEIKNREITIENGSIKYSINQFSKANDPTGFIASTLNTANPSELLGCSEEVMNTFKIVTNLEEPKQNVSYPINVGGEFHYEWFMANKMTKRGSSGVRPMFNKELPKKADKPSLPKYKKF